MALRKSTHHSPITSPCALTHRIFTPCAPILKLKFIFNFAGSFPMLKYTFIAIALCTAALTQSGPIQDNSFLIEEAYNQEPGVVQHISTFTHLSDGSWAYTFTQEWPVPGHEKHQLSYTVVANTDPEFGGYGFGDTLLNYRYQLVGNGETRVAVAPRISLEIPTGSVTWGRGAGGTGVQFNLPVSIALGRHFVSHSNVGATLVPHACNRDGDRASATSFNAGQSFIWLARPRFNVLVETMYLANASVVSSGQTERSHDFFISPGIRWAHNFASGLQIVPGIGLPVGFGSSSGQKGIILYLSFEHPLWKESRR